MAAVMFTSTLGRSVLLALLCVAGFGGGVALSIASLSSAPSEANDLSTSSLRITPPSPNLTPEQVVTLQVTALREFRHNNLALLQCFCLASPANRAATGPLERFAAMVQNPKYRVLVANEAALVGRSVVKENRAAVLVTVIDAERRASVFRFFLSKQTEAPFEDCWMTDAVTPDVDPPSPQPSTDPLALDNGAGGSTEPRLQPHKT